MLKRFGPSSKGIISFPKSGWTLAIDLPANIPNLLSTLNEIDEIVASNSGKLYLAKDSRMSSDIFKKTYTNYSRFKSIKEILDPKGIFYSDLAERLKF